jgi:hypothetical protein
MQNGFATFRRSFPVLNIFGENFNKPPSECIHGRQRLEALSG